MINIQKSYTIIIKPDTNEHKWHAGTLIYMNINVLIMIQVNNIQNYFENVYKLKKIQISLNFFKREYKNVAIHNLAS